ncbi:MAG TPA: hypothetical protein PLK31_25825, partial [Chloroflexota bacterium]|nr:hypothetical protein [Chloroflexota bacterium]
MMEELQAGLGQGGQMLALYQNAAGQSAGQDMLWQNPVDYHGPFQVGETFTANTGATTMRLALEVNLDAGYLAFNSFDLQHLTEGDVI